MLVVDASVVAPLLIDSGARGEAVQARIAGQRLHAPALIDVEVLSILRRHAAAGLVTPERAAIAVEDLGGLPVRRRPMLPLRRRAWELRHSITAYDAVYVALAELLEVPLLTADARLARAPGPRCEMELLTD